MKAVVTGATGFLGRKTARRLQGLGYNVIALGRNQEIGEMLQREGLAFEAVDLNETQRLKAVCAGADYVIHCAALSSPWGDYDAFYSANVLGTQSILAACDQACLKRFVHISTPSLYFQFDERLNIAEDDPLPATFVNHYAETKYLAERVVDEAFQQGMPVITIRPRALFGPEDHTIIPRLIETNRKKFIPLIHDGQALLDLTYVENVVEAILLCMDSPEASLGEKYNITNGERVHLKDILEKVFDQLDMPFNTKKIPFSVAFSLAGLMEWGAKHFRNNEEPPLTRYTVSVLAKSQTLSIEKAKRELGYEPRISIEEGIQQFVTWWKEEKHD
ncbi:NAD(P)-dependent oxidoreductase [Bacillus tianshenii]|nr:NAD(P)-dependent oxidoreductase [Bacillus tianshenii]